MHQILADIVLLLHAAVVLFVIGGALALPLGHAKSWRWVDAPGFRYTHLAGVGFIVLQSWLGATCPLTTLESWLRQQAGGAGYSQGFIEHWVHRMLFYEAPTWVFVGIYSAFGLLVLAGWMHFPVRRMPAAHPAENRLMRAQMRTLSAGPCTLEPQRSAHAAEMFAVLSDPAIYEFENQPPVSEAWLTQRFERLESRTSSDGSELWLNWVVRLPSGELAGYVQATVLPSGEALLAYELASRFWRRGLASAAVRAMMEELSANYGVRGYIAALKTANHRSMGLLRHLGFGQGSEQQRQAAEAETDETLMKLLGPLR